MTVSYIQRVNVTFITYVITKVYKVSDGLFLKSLKVLIQLRL